MAKSTIPVHSGESISNEEKKCPTHGIALKSGMKYQDICLECEPCYKQWCSGCERRLWDCLCIKPHTWE